MNSFGSFSSRSSSESMLMRPTPPPAVSLLSVSQLKRAMAQQQAAAITGSISVMVPTSSEASQASRAGRENRANRGSSTPTSANASRKRKNSQNKDEYESIDAEKASTWRRAMTKIPTAAASLAAAASVPASALHSLHSSLHSSEPPRVPIRSNSNNNKRVRREEAFLQDTVGKEIIVVEEEKMAQSHPDDSMLGLQAKEQHLKRQRQQLHLNHQQLQLHAQLLEQQEEELEQRKQRLLGLQEEPRQLPPGTHLFQSRHDEQQHYATLAGGDMDDAFLESTTTTTTLFRPQLPPHQCELRSDTIVVRPASDSEGDEFESNDVTRSDIFRLVEFMQQEYLLAVADDDDNGRDDEKASLTNAVCGCEAVIKTLRRTLLAVWNEQMDPSQVMLRWDFVKLLESPLLLKGSGSKSLPTTCTLFKVLDKLKELVVKAQWQEQTDKTMIALTRTDVYLVVDIVSEVVSDQDETSESSTSACSASKFLRQIPIGLQKVWDDRLSKRQVTRWDVFQIISFIQRQYQVSAASVASAYAAAAIGNDTAQTKRQKKQARKHEDALEVWRHLPRVLQAVASKKVAVAVADNGTVSGELAGLCVVAKPMPSSSSSSSSAGTVNNANFSLVVPASSPRKPPVKTPRSTSAASSFRPPLVPPPSPRNVSQVAASSFFANTSLKPVGPLPVAVRQNDFIIECLLTATGRVQDFIVGYELVSWLGSSALSRLVQRTENEIRSNPEVVAKLQSLAKRVVVRTPMIWMCDPPASQLELLEAIGFRQHQDPPVVNPEDLQKVTALKRLVAAAVASSPLAPEQESPTSAVDAVLAAVAAAEAAVSAADAALKMPPPLPTPVASPSSSADALALLRFPSAVVAPAVWYAFEVPLLPQSQDSSLVEPAISTFFSPTCKLLHTLVVQDRVYSVR